MAALGWALPRPGRRRVTARTLLAQDAHSGSWVGRWGGGEPAGSVVGGWVVQKQLLTLFGACCFRGRFGALLAPPRGGAILARARA